MYCSQCGKPVGDNAKFCVNCGTPVGYEEPKVVTPPVVEQPVVVPVVSVPPVQIYEAPRKTSCAAAIVLSSISAFIMLIAFAVIMENFDLYGITSDTVIGCWIIFAIPAFILSMIGFIRANKARQSQQTTGAKVVFTISLILFIVASLFFAILFICMVTGAGEVPYQPGEFGDTYL